ncbi:MAG: hypothetical protein ACK5JD_17820 [Mangrovibacterium sp.]
MITKYYTYKTLDQKTEQLFGHIIRLKHRTNLHHSMNQLLQTRGFSMDEAVKRVITIFRMTGIPEEKHISRVYRDCPSGILKSWCLSDLACMLIIMGAGGDHDGVSEIQEQLFDEFGLSQMAWFSTGK